MFKKLIRLLAKIGNFTFKSGNQIGTSLESISKN